MIKIKLIMGQITEKGNSLNFFLHDVGSNSTHKVNAAIPRISNFLR